MSALRILLDTNVLIDLYTQRPPDGGIAQKLLIMREFGDAELWVSAKSFTDVFYVLHKRYSSKRIQDAFAESLNWLEVCSLDANDIRLATDRAWHDFEDCLISVCAEKVKADIILTRDKKGFTGSSIQCLAPADFFTLLKEDHGVVYEMVDTSTA